MNPNTELKKKIDKYKQNKERINECNHILNTYLENIENDKEESESKYSDEETPTEINFDEIYKTLENNKNKINLIDSVFKL